MLTLDTPMPERDEATKALEEIKRRDTGYGLEVMMAILVMMIYFVSMVLG